MDIRPILSTLRRHKTAAALIVFEIALSCAIICNALFLISERIDRMNRPTGQAENELVRVQVTGIATNSKTEALTREDLAALRALPGVKAATSTNQTTFGNSSWNSGVKLDKDQAINTLSASTYMGDEHYLATTGLSLIAGRNFTPDELVEWEELNQPKGGVPSAIISQSMAQTLYPGESAVGKTLYIWGDTPTKVVGVVEHLVRPNNQAAAEGYENAILMPVHVPYSTGNYLLRVAPERRAETLEAAFKTIERNGANRIILRESSGTLEDMRAKFYQQDRAMAWMLVAVIVALLVVTALGIVGLASFWVQQRTKQIGVRRALGATRGQILRYFQTENFLLATLGIVVGMVGAYAINQLLMGRYELPRLPLMYLPVGALALWALGQLSVLGPARRAAAVPPAVATRSV